MLLPFRSYCMGRVVDRLTPFSEEGRKKKKAGFCIYCKKHINESSKFCPNCGEEKLSDPDLIPIKLVKPKELKGNLPPLKFFFNDELNESVTTFTLIQNDEYCNVYLVCSNHSLDVVDEYQILHHWKQPSEMQIGINQVNGYDVRIRWVDTYVGTRVGEWEGLAMNFVRRALSHIIDERGNPLNLDEEFL